MLMKLTQVSLVTQGDPATKTTKYLLACSGLSSSSGEELSFELELSAECNLRIDEKSGKGGILFSASLSDSSTFPSELKTNPASQSESGAEEINEGDDEALKKILQRSGLRKPDQYIEGEAGDFVDAVPANARKVGVDEADIEEARRRAAEALKKGEIDMPAQEELPRPLKR